MRRRDLRGTVKGGRGMKKGLGYRKMNRLSVDIKCPEIFYCFCRCSAPMLGHNLPSPSCVPTSSKFLCLLKRSWRAATFYAASCQVRV